MAKEDDMMLELVNSSLLLNDLSNLHNVIFSKTKTCRQKRREGLESAGAIVGGLIGGMFGGVIYGPMNTGIGERVGSLFGTVADAIIGIFY